VLTLKNLRDVFALGTRRDGQHPVAVAHHLLAVVLVQGQLLGGQHPFEWLTEHG